VSEYDEIGQKVIRHDQLDRPYALCTDREGKGMFVSDAHNCRLLRFDLEKGGKTGDQLLPPPGMRQSTGAPEAIKYPRCIFQMEGEGEEADDRLVVVDTWSHRVLMVEPGSQQEPTLLAGVPNSFGTRTDQLSYPTSAVFLPASASSSGDEKAAKEDSSSTAFKRTLLVSDSANNRVLRFQPGEQCGSLVLGNLMCSPGKEKEELDMPAGLCLCPKTGALIVADKNNHRLLRVPKPAEATPKTAEAEVLLGPEELKTPWAVCFDSEGFLYVSDEGHHRVLKLELDA
jgi:hypothetical protein